MHIIEVEGLETVYSRNIQDPTLNLLNIKILFS